jgi:MFS transporter, CP family, cyanate transporter
VDETQRRRAAAGAGLLIAGALLIAANLRPAVTSVPPLLPEIRRDLDLTSAAVALLTTLPVLCFGALAPVAPRLGRRLGLERTLALALVALASGLLLRTIAGPVPLFAGTIAAGGAIAIANTLLPALVKRDFPTQAGTATGVYSAALIVAAAIAAATSVPLDDALGGWRPALGFWALPAIGALVVWFPQARRRTTAGVAAPGGMRRMLRSPLAWQVTAFTGLQSLGFYGLVTWLPTIYRDHGYGRASSGVLLSILTVVGAPLALVLPARAARARDQRASVAFVTALTAAGMLGLLVAPTAAPYLWVVIIGIGQAPSLPIALTLIVLRSRDSDDTARLSAMAQSIGYLLAAAGPVVMGAMHDATGSWTAPVALLAALTVPQLFFGLAAARAKVV